jgi:hypothetical protein
MTAFVAVVACSACGSPSIGDDLPVELPDRQPIATPTDGGDATTTIAPDDAAPAPLPQDAAADAFVTTQNALLCGAPNLALCFAFEGSVVDSSANKLVPTVSGVTFGPGQLGQAGVFGAASAVRFAPNAAFEVMTGTIEAWVNLAPNPASDGVIFDDDNRMSLTILADGTVQCIPNGGAATAKIVAGTWTHVACVFDGTTAHVYVAGDEIGTGPIGIIGSSPTSTAAIGGNAPSGEPFLGSIDSFRVFNVARTAAQIATAAGK